VAERIGGVALDVLTPAGITGGVLLAAVLVFASLDYRRKPAFRVRRSMVSCHDPRPDGPRPDWTYTTRTK
jgi:hypothetical protein